MKKLNKDRILELMMELDDEVVLNYDTNTLEDCRGEFLLNLDLENDIIDMLENGDKPGAKCVVKLVLNYLRPFKDEIIIKYNYENVKQAVLDLGLNVCNDLVMVNDCEDNEYSVTNISDLVDILNKDDDIIPTTGENIICQLIKEKI